MTSIVEHLLNVRGVLVYLLVGLLALAEDALFVGFVIPGETAAVLGGVIASRDHVDYPLIAVIVVAAAIIGDTVGYEIGRHPGPRILRVPILDQRRGRLDDAQSSLRRRGGSAVFLGRFVAFFRAVMPALAGSWHRCMRPVLSRPLPPTRWLPSWAAARWRGTARCGSWDFCSG
jgi:membrane protein DedA with SNARE-associated domain